MVKTGYFVDFRGNPANWSWLRNTHTQHVMAEIPNSGSHLYRDSLRKTTKNKQGIQLPGINIGMRSELAENPLNINQNKNRDSIQYYSQVWDFLLYLQDNVPNWDALPSLQQAQYLLGKSSDASFNGKGALLYPNDWLESYEGTITPPYSSTCFWAQDLELKADQASSTAVQAYAGIIALLWAGRTYLGKDFKITPVVSKSINTNLYYDDSKGAYTKELVNFKDVHSFVAKTFPKALPNYFKPEELKNIPNTVLPDTGKVITRTSWNFMSLLKLNGLIDGFISQDYTQKPVSGNHPLVMNPVAAAYAPTVDLPYALMGSWNNPKEIPQRPELPPSERIPIHFHGSLPVDSGVYFFADQKKPKDVKAMQKNVTGFKPESYFIPVQQHLMAHNASKAQADGNCVVDLSSLPLEKTLQLDIHLSREAEYSSYCGFYKIHSLGGAVKDPLSGELLLPGDIGYRTAALADENKITELDRFQLAADGAKNSALSADLRGELMMAPYAVVTQPGVENIFFNFAKANPDNFQHFKKLSANRFGMEDIFGGGDKDFNDLIIDIQFLEVI